MPRMSPTASATRLAVGALALVVASLTAGCAAEGDEQAGPQFPSAAQGRRSPPMQPAGAELAPGQEDPGARYGQTEQEEVGRGGDTIVIGGDPSTDSEDAAPAEPQAEPEYADADPSALTDFHAALDPYGQWVEDPTYGTVWEPSVSAVGTDFAPYESGGHWAYGDDYVWVSDYSWGWAPFHYGRWVYATNGWGWIPGRQYAGAWTSWRTGYGPYAGYVGWAPLPPTWYWRNGYAVGIGVVPPAAYGFCRTGDLFASSLGGRMVGGPQVGALGPYTRPMQGAVAATGRAGGYGGGYGGAGSSGGRTLAHPEIAGPTPQSMHIAANAVTRPPLNNAGLNRAAQFAHPSTAVALGAHPPAGSSAGVVGARGAAAGSRMAARPYASSLGTSAYGHYDGGVRTTRTIGGAGRHPSYGGGSRGYGSFHGAPAYSYGGGGHFHGGMSHGGGGQAAPPQYHPSYGGGYHPSASGGHFGGHGGGGRR